MPGQRTHTSERRTVRTRSAAFILFSGLLFALWAGACDGGLSSLTSGGVSSDDTFVDPLALPQTSSRDATPDIAARKSLQDWVRSALAVTARIAVHGAEFARQIIVELPGAPAAPEGLTLVWSFGDGTHHAGPDARHTYAVAGTFDVAVAIVHPLLGPVYFDRVRVVVSDEGLEEVIQIAGPPLAVALVDPPGGPAPLAVSMDGAASRPGTGNTLLYEWTFGDGAHSTRAQDSHVYSTPGDYVVTLRVTDSSGASASAGVQVHVSPPSNSQQDSDSTDQPPPPDTDAPLPKRPLPRRSFFGILADGGYKLEEGPGPGKIRNLAIQAMPMLAQYGFGRFVSATYMGVARSVADATAYYGPLVDAAEAHGMTVVGGFNLHHIVDNLYGPSFEPPWNLPDTPENRAKHPMTPEAVGEQQFWDELVTRVEVVAAGSRANQVYLDCEYVFFIHRDDPFWTDQMLADIRLMARDAVSRLQQKGIFLIMRHPEARPFVPALARIAHGIFAPDDENDPLAQIEFFANAPYWYTTSYTLPEPTKIVENHITVGFFEAQVRFGFISNHAAFPPHTYGFSPAQYDAYCNEHPGIAERTWFVASPETIVPHATKFAELAEQQQQ